MLNRSIRFAASAVLLLTLATVGQAAEYRVTFTGTWSADTHPVGFPGNPHFSPLIGGTHDDSVAFWAAGELASLGIQRMAEWGSQVPLDAEVEAAIAAGSAEFVLRDDEVPDSPGTASLDFAINEDHSLVTLVTMVAPSPDWFVGVAGLDLRPGGQWVESLTVTLWPYDAGTDSGVNYNSPDQPTSPHQPISAITTLPLGNGVALGTFEFVRLDQTTDVPATGGLALTSAPNPFNPATTLSFSVPQDGPVQLEVFDLAGRRVATPVTGFRAAGRHQVPFAPRGLASGAYLARLTTSAGVVTSRMMLVE